MILRRPNTSEPARFGSIGTAAPLIATAFLALYPASSAWAASASSGGSSLEERAHSTADHPDTAVCTVCAGRSTHGSDPEPEEVAAVSVYDGKRFYFCSTECKEEFDQSPAWWVPMALPYPVLPLEVTTLGGETIALPIGDGVPTVLDFWATWCQPCKKTMRDLQRRFETVNGDQLRIVGLSIDDGQAASRKVARYLRKHGLSYPVFLDDQPAPAWTALKVRAVPTMMLVDGEGRVLWRYTGPDGDDRLDEALRELGL